MLERVFKEPKFRVRCLGRVRLVETGSGVDVTPTSRKTRALIGYLCVVQKPVERERLASLLWGDRGDDQARASLRQAIYELRSATGGVRLLKVEREAISIGEDVGTDVAEIIAAAQSNDLKQLSLALSEWRGDLLQDLPTIDSTFDLWLQTERLQVQERIVDAAAEAVRAGMARGDVRSSRRVINLLQQRDSTNEAVLRLGLRLDHLAGDSAGLHGRYKRFRELLKAELNAAPALETQKLFHELAPSTAPATVESARLSSDAEPRERIEQNGDACLVDPVPAVIAQVAGAPNTKASPLTFEKRSVYRIRLAAVAVAIAFLCALIWFVWASSSTPGLSGGRPLLAVLPFQNLSGDPTSRYISGGIAQEIVNALVPRTEVRVVPLSSLRLHNASAPHRLDATEVLSGSVERTGDRFHVIAQLMDIQGGRVIWSRAYDAATDHAPERREDIALRIAATVGKLLLSGSADGGQHVSSAARDRYLKGRVLVRQHNARAAATEFEESIRLAPNFAEAWSALAVARRLLATSALVAHKEQYDPSLAAAARAAAKRALLLDPRNGQALGVLALLTAPAQLREIDLLFQRALRSEPDNPQLLAWHGEFLMFVGRNHDALDELTRAFELDSATPSVTSNLVLACLKTGHFEEGKEVIDLIASDRSLRTETLRLRVKYFLYMGDWFRLSNYLRVLPGGLSPPMTAFLRLSHETGIALATREVDKFHRLSASWRTEALVDPSDAVQFLAALGDTDGALTAAESAVNLRRNDDLLTDPEWEVLFDPNLVPLRRNPRVPALFANWGLLDYWRTANRWPDFIR